MSIRVDAIVVAELKDEAERMDIPYQPLINSVVHSFVTVNWLTRGRKELGKQPVLQPWSL